VHPASRVTFWTVLRNALALNADFYESARSTARNRWIALTIVFLAALSRAVGSLAILLINQVTIEQLLLVLLLDGLAVILGYYFWTFVVFKVGQWLKPIDPTYRHLLVPIGFAYTPQIFNFLTLIPLLGRPIELILAAWSLLAVIVAVRQGLDIRSRWATVICLLGWIPVQMMVGFVQFFGS
jgi:hypothetical protein